MSPHAWFFSTNDIFSWVSPVSIIHCNTFAHNFSWSCEECSLDIQVSIFMTSVSINLSYDKACICVSKLSFINTWFGVPGTRWVRDHDYWETYARDSYADVMRGRAFFNPRTSPLAYLQANSFFICLLNCCWHNQTSNNYFLLFASRFRLW